LTLSIVGRYEQIEDGTFASLFLNLQPLEIVEFFRLLRTMKYDRLIERDLIHRKF
jgi:hypothetical protein